MSNENIYDGITGIREDIIERAENYEFKKVSSKKNWMKGAKPTSCVPLWMKAKPPKN